MHYAVSLAGFEGLTFYLHILFVCTVFFMDWNLFIFWILHIMRLYFSICIKMGNIFGAFRKRREERAYRARPWTRKKRSRALPAPGVKYDTQKRYNKSQERERMRKQSMEDYDYDNPDMQLFQRRKRRSSYRRRSRQRRSRRASQRSRSRRKSRSGGRRR